MIHKRQLLELELTSDSTGVPAARLVNASPIPALLGEAAFSSNE